RNRTSWRSASSSSPTAGSATSPAPTSRRSSRATTSAAPPEPPPRPPAARPWVTLSRPSLRACHAHRDPHRHRGHHVLHLVRQGRAVPVRAPRTPAFRRRARPRAGGAALAGPGGDRERRPVPGLDGRRDPAGLDRRGPQAHRAQGAAGHGVGGRLPQRRLHRAGLPGCRRGAAALGCGGLPAGRVLVRLRAGVAAAVRQLRRRRPAAAVPCLLRHRRGPQARSRQLPRHCPFTGARSQRRAVPVGRGGGTRRRARGRHAHRAGRPPRRLPAATHRRSDAWPRARGKFRRNRSRRGLMARRRATAAVVLSAFAALALLLPACAADESVTERDRRLLADDMAALAPQTPGVADLYVVGFAGDSTEDVFRNEVAYLDMLMSRRFGAQGRVVTLVNHLDSFTTAPRPLATLENLRIALAGVGKAMDRDEDVLLLYLTMHGTPEHELAVSLPPVLEEWITPEQLRAALDDA